MSTESPKLLLVNSAVNFSSTGKIVEQLGTVARKDGWATYVAHGTRYVKQSELEDLHIESPWEERIHGVKSKLFDDHGLGSANSTRRLVEKIVKIRPDVIHLHNIHGYFINYQIEKELKNESPAGLYGKETCRRRAVVHFNKYERYQDYIDLYNSLIGRK